ncbi:beta-ketoacyl synthase N-terminal-like domain-containing protein [Streptomyces sp. NPDC059008]|uniref:beta-ketoacyl synthase N-terminal-like domain-containing protein n=1 Tax=Streptomyces sp. NPDC059008 TaxID=3346693 RepID=UPI00368BB773
MLSLPAPSRSRSRSRSPSRSSGSAAGPAQAHGPDAFRRLLRGGGDAIIDRRGRGPARGGFLDRVSYALGLNGPGLVVDTGQSSSLAAVHLAAREPAER